jgi:uncharacterized protein
VRTPEGEEAADYANQLEGQWRIAKKGSDRGVLVLLAVDNHKWRIDVGYGLEGIPPDVEIGEIGGRWFRTFAPRTMTMRFWPPWVRSRR